MQTPDYWYQEILTLMGATPDDIAKDQTEEGKKQVELFKKYIRRVQDDAAQ